jgi:hypothetical protein
VPIATECIAAKKHHYSQHKPGGNFVIERLSGSQIDDELEPGRLFGRKIGGLSAAQQPRRAAGP